MSTTRSVNPEQLAGAVRQLLLFGSGVAVGRGAISKDTMQAIITNFDVLLPAVVTVATVVWGWWARKDSNLVVSASNVPTVEAVVDPVLGPALPDNEKVITPMQAQSVGIMGRQ